MARAHKLSGTLAGIPIADTAVAVGAPVWTAFVVLPLATGAALLPDLDCDGSTATLALGWVTKWFVSRPLQLFCRTTYFFTRGWEDRVSRGAHRTLSHTFLGCLAFGGLTWWLAALLLPPLFAAYAPLWGATVAVGALAHVAGDMLTMSGCPVAWPLKIDGQRWREIRSPLPFHTDGMTERMFVVPFLRVLICVAGGYPLPISWQASMLLGLAWNAAVFLFGKRTQFVPVQTTRFGALLGGRRRSRSRRARRRR